MEQYDVVVVGGGTAGLFCSNYLARYGKKTLLLEHNHQPGGLTGGFWRKKFYWDAGDQSFESAGIMLPLIQSLGLYHPADWEFAEYTLAYEQGSVLMKNKDKALTELIELFPEQREEMRALFTKMKDYARLLGGMSSDATSPLNKTGLARLASIAELTRFFFANRDEMKEMMSRSIPDLYNEYLPPSDYRERMVNTGYRNMPIGLGVGFWHTWFDDYWYYKRGLQALMDDLAQNFINQGGVMHCNQTVDEVLIENKKATGVKTKDGNYYYGKKVVFAGALKKLYTELIDSDLLDPVMVDEIKEAPVSEPLNALYLGVDMTDQELSRYLTTHHTLYFPDGPVPDYDNATNKKMHETAFTEINWTSMHNKKLAPPDKNAIVLQSFSSYKWMDNWGTKGDDFSRPKKYKDLKKTVADQMIETANRYVPGIKDRIEYQTLGSPLSTVHFTLNPEGASCGWSMALGKSYLQDKWLSLTTPFENLYSVGHFTFWPGGVPMAALSGVIVAQMIKHDTKVERLHDLANLFKKTKVF